MQTNLEKIKSRIMSISELPTLPTVVMEVMSLTQDPDSSISDIVKVIHNDPSITSKVLKVANSAFYGMRQKIDSINRALVVLGMNEVNSLVTSISVFKTFPIEVDKATFDRMAFWEHCAVTGEIAKALSSKLGMKIMGEVFTAGLLHDIGKIILDQYFHDEFMEAVDVSYEDEIPLFEAEKQVFGVTHSQIGGWVGEKWKLPRNLVDSILYHHKPARSISFKVLTSIVSLANMFSKMLDDSFASKEIKSQITATVAWKILENEMPQINNIDFDKFIVDLEVLVDNAKEFISIVR